MRSIIGSRSVFPRPSSSPGQLFSLKMKKLLIEIADELDRNFRDFAGKSMGNNSDGEAILWGYKRLIRMPQKRKIQIVLSDGGVDNLIDVGVLQDKPESGQAGAVRYTQGNITKVKYGGTIAVGDKLKSNAASGAGKAVATTTSGNRVLGIALVAGVLNDIGYMLCEPGYYP